MKKALSVLLSLVLLVGSLAVLPTAAKGTSEPVTLYLGGAEAGQGETLWAPIWLGADSHLVNLDMVMEYDTDKLKFSGQEDSVQGDIWKGDVACNEPEVGRLKIAAAKSGNGYTQAGLLMKIAFEVLDTSASSADITFTVPNIAANVDGEDTKTTVRALTGLTVMSPTKTEYQWGETLDTTGLTVTATYDDGTSGPVSGYVLQGGDNLVAGNNTIRVEYLDQAQTFTVHMAPPEEADAEITTKASRLEFVLGEEVDLTGLTVTLTYMDGSTKVVSEGLTAQWDTAATGEVTVTVLYQGQALVTYPVSVFAPGDVNNDGSINSKDARLVLQYAVSATTLTELQVKLAEVNADTSVDSKDARWILQKAVS